MEKYSQKWYAVYTKPNHEKKVAGLLSHKKIENYCPLNKIYRQWSDRKKVVEVPLFTSYVFVRLSDQEFSQVKETPGVINFVYWLGKPAVIRDEEIDTIKEFLVNYSHVQLEKSLVRINDHVRILNGLLEELEGNVVVVMPKTVRVTLPSLGYALTATVSKDNIQKLGMGNNHTAVFN